MNIANSVWFINIWINNKYENTQSTIMTAEELEFDPEEIQEFVEIAVEELKQGIDIEQNIVQESHSVADKLESLSYIILHLDSTVPSNLQHVHSLIQSVGRAVNELLEFIESHDKKRAHIIEEEAHLRDKLENDIAHRAWRMAKCDIHEESLEVTAAEKYESKSMKKIHRKFKAIVRLMNKHHLVKALKKDSAWTHEKSKFTEQWHYYLMQLYHFFEAYENVISQLVDKEKELADK